jgi:hypothetical protein
MANTAKEDTENEFFGLLAERLMLAELLGGECCPIEFLKNEIVNSHDDLMRIRRARVIDRITSSKVEQ